MHLPRAFLPAAALALGAVFHAVASTAPASPSREGWTPLFNGWDLTGWTVQCVPADREKIFWRAVDGAIEVDSLADPEHDYVWLQTRNEYGDFVLRLKFQAFRSSPGNSGVQIRSRYDASAGWLDGPQIDINPAGPWRTGMIWDETREQNRWIWPDIPKGQWVKPGMALPGMVFLFAEEGWNALEIEARGTRIRATLNGTVITDYDGAGVLDDEAHRARNVGMRGFIALQLHRKDRLKIRFKDIEVRELSPGEG